jgi:hypothetical protein
VTAVRSSRARPVKALAPPGRRNRRVAIAIGLRKLREPDAHDVGHTIGMTTSSCLERRDDGLPTSGARAAPAGDGPGPVPGRA